MKKRVLILIALSVLAKVIFATPYQDISELGTSAGMIGLGNVGGFTDSATVLLEPPGGLSHAGNSLSAFYTQLFGDISYYTGAATLKATEKLTIGLGFTHENDGSVDITGESNSQAVSQSQFTPTTTQIVGGIDYALSKDLNIGTTCTLYHRNQSKLTGIGAGLGAGLKTTGSWGELILYGKNMLGGKVTYTSSINESLIHEYGVSIKTPIIRTIVNTELLAQIRNLSELGVSLKGAGLRIYPLETPQIGINLGYKEKYQIGTQIRSLFCGGISLKLDQLTVEYGYDTTDLYQQENQHYFSVSINY